MEKYIELAKKLRAKITLIQQYSTTTSFGIIFQAGAEILNLLSYLGSVEAELEVKYRRVIDEARKNGESIAAADVIGKASDEYLQFRKLQNLLVNGDRAYMFLKKFKDALDSEEKRI